MMAVHTAKKIRTGPIYTTRVWEYRGVRMEGTPPRHGWGGQKGAGGGWSWSAEVKGKNLLASTKRELQAKIDAQLGAA